MMLIKIKECTDQDIYIPKTILDAANLSVGDNVEVVISNETILISKRKIKSLEDLFEGFDGEYESIDVDWGKPAGSEIW